MPALAVPMVADADRRAARVDPSTIVRGETLRRAGLQAAAAAILAFAVAFAGRGVARQSFDAAALALFPSRVTLEVTPGSTRVPAGTSLVITARLVGNTTPIVGRSAARRHAGQRGLASAGHGEPTPSGGFVLSLDDGDNAVPLPRGGRSGRFGNLPGRRAARPARDPDRRRVPLSGFARTGPAYRGGRRRHFRPGGYRGPPPRARRPVLRLGLDWCWPMERPSNWPPQEDGPAPCSKAS